MRRIRSVFLFTFLLMMSILVTVPVSAKYGAEVKGAVFPSYTRTVVLSMSDPNINEKLGINKKYDLKTDIKKFLIFSIDLAAKKASNKTRYKIVIAPGTYTVPASTKFSIPGNTWLYAKGATINFRNCNRACLFTNHMKYRSGGLANERVVKSSQNILIEGGTWDMSMFGPDDSYGTTAPIRYCNTKNLAFKNMKIMVNRKYHIMEFADVNGLTIRNCLISRNDRNNETQPKEAIQLDVAEDSAYNKCIQNGKGCHNVIIEKCRIYNCARGIGSHNSLGGNIQNPSYTNVTIRNNSLKNIKGEAIHLLHGKNCTISGNTINGARRTGIYIEDCSNLLVTKNQMSNIKAFTGNRTVYGTFKAGVTYARSNNNSITNNTVTDGSVKKCVTTYGSGGSGNKISGNKP